jgi:SAM-dependent methyltransferase
VEEGIYDLMREKEEHHWWFRGRRAVIDAFLVRAGLTGPLRVLDAGCGTGGNFASYARFGELEGIDPSPAAVEYCRRRGFSGVVCGDAERLPFDDGRFGLVTATDVLEHVADDRTALAEMRRVASSNGALLITVPAYRWLWSPEDERLGHHRRYTYGRLRERLTEAGWTPVSNSYFNPILMPPIAVAKRLVRSSASGNDLERTPGWLDGALLQPMRLEAALIRRGARLPAGVSLGVVCRRS